MSLEIYKRTERVTETPSPQDKVILISDAYIRRIDSHCIIGAITVPLSIPSFLKLQFLILSGMYIILANLLKLLRDVACRQRVFRHYAEVGRVTQQFVLHASMITLVLNPYEHLLIKR
jgi:hypothetical protein